MTSAGHDGIILLVTHEGYQAGFYACVLRWIKEHASDCFGYFRMTQLPANVPDSANVRLVVMWLQDPVEAWSMEIYMLAEGLADFHDRRGIPVINRPRCTSNATKSVAAPLIASAGFRVPRMARLNDRAAFDSDCARVGFPLFIRDDRKHGSAMLLARSIEEARSIPLDSFTSPVAIEFIDVADRNDGFFRKYRYFTAGDIGVPHHLQVSNEWIARGEGRVVNDATKEEELSYVGKPDPHHQRFQTARRALGLDVAAFDYSYDHEGNVVVWEVNPFAFIQFGRTTTTYRNHAIHRTIAAMTATYLQRAGFAVPAEVTKWLDY